MSCNHNLLPRAAALLALAAGTALCAADGVRFTAGGFLSVDGAPRLILGMYELPKEDVKLKELAESGFNRVRAPAREDALDRVRKHGLRAWIPLGSALALREEDVKGHERLATTIERFKGHPALLVWEAPDEALWNVWYRRMPWVFSNQTATRSTVAMSTLKPACVASQQLSTPYCVIDVSPVSRSG